MAIHSIHSTRARSSELSWRVQARTSGQSIHQALREHSRHWTDGHIAKLIRQDRVLVDGKPADFGQLLRGGERLQILPAPERPHVYLPNRNVRVKVLHQDGCVAVVVKPAGLTVHPGPGHGSQTLLNGLLALYREELEELGLDRGWGLVHRLDRDASGLLVVARSPSSYDALRAQFETRTIGKRYLTLLAGVPAEDHIQCDGAVHGQSALSRFTVLERFRDCSLAEVEIVTGRKHQIRWHAASLGHPVVGDLRYGPDRPPEHPLRNLGLHRMFLHARSLSFTHPATLQRLTFNADLPRELRRPLERLRRGGQAPAAQEPDAVDATVRRDEDEAARSARKPSRKSRSRPSRP